MPGTKRNFFITTEFFLWLFFISSALQIKHENVKIFTNWTMSHMLPNQGKSPWPNMVPRTIGHRFPYNRIQKAKLFRTKSYLASRLHVGWMHSCTSFIIHGVGVIFSLGPCLCRAVWPFTWVRAGSLITHAALLHFHFPFFFFSSCSLHSTLAS